MLIKKIFKLFISIVLFVFVINNVNAAKVDNILNTFFYSHNDSSYLIIHESLFHPTSGSYEKGNIRSQGFNTSQISV